MRIIVCGGRDYADVEAVCLALRPYKLVKATVVVGDARGADKLAAMVAMDFGMPVEVHEADWKGLGRSAGPHRNQEMVDAGADLLLAFPGGRGTADCVRRAQAAGIPMLAYGQTAG